MKSHFVSIDPDGSLRLPPSLVRRLHLDEAGMELHISEREDGVLEIRATSVEQRWFWSERWQAMEREADEDIAAGRVLTFDGVDEFFDHLGRHSDDH
jgi:hypothetical protein